MAGRCKGCGASSSSRWYKDKTQCHNCYNRVRRDVLAGIPETESTWNVWQDYNPTKKPIKINTGLCLVCGTTKATEWSDNGNLCRKCYNKNYSLGICDLCGYDKQVRVTFGGRGQLCKECWQSNFKGYHRGRYYRKTTKLCPMCDKEKTCRFINGICDDCGE